jgi:hypothetical protein
MVMGWANLTNMLTTVHDGTATEVTTVATGATVITAAIGATVTAATIGATTIITMAAAGVEAITIAIGTGRAHPNSTRNPETLSGFYFADNKTSDLFPTSQKSGSGTVFCNWGMRILRGKCEYGRGRKDTAHV